MIHYIVYNINENIKTKDTIGITITKNDLNNLYNYICNDNEFKRIQNNCNIEFDMSDLINILILFNFANECDMPDFYTFNWNLMLDYELKYSKFLKVCKIKTRVHNNKFWLD